MATSGTACVFIDEVQVGDLTAPSADSASADPNEPHDSDEPGPTTQPDDEPYPTTTHPAGDSSGGSTGSDIDSDSDTEATGPTPSTTGEVEDTGSDTTGEVEDTGSDTTGATEDTGSDTTGEPPPPDLCGNGVVDPGETCDDGFNDGAHSSCLSGCIARAPYCGDGEVNAEGELCDDGNSFDNDACNHECQPTGCGDGIVQPGEECDTSIDPTTCESLGYTGGMVGCDVLTCKYDVSLCVGCGNGLMEGEEVCDAADLGGASCESLGFSGGVLECNGKCSALETSGCLAPLPPNGDCCAPGSCSTVTIETCVCEQSPECCDVVWSQLCVDIGIQSCSAQCL